MKRKYFRARKVLFGATSALKGWAWPQISLGSLRPSARPPSRLEDHPLRLCPRRHSPSMQCWIQVDATGFSIRLIARAPPTSICCGFVVQHAAQKAVRQIHNRSKHVEFEPDKNSLKMSPILAVSYVFVSRPAAIHWFIVGHGSAATVPLCVYHLS